MTAILRVYPPDWIFATPQSVREIKIGDLLECEMESGTGTSEEYCPNCDGRRFVVCQEITSRGSLTWIDGKKFNGKLRTAACPVCRGEQMESWLKNNCGLLGLELDGKQ